MMVFYRWRHAKGWGEVPRVSLPREQPSTRHAFTPTEVERICQHASKDLARAVRIAYALGLRLGECHALDESWLEGATLVIPPEVAKSGRTDRIALTEAERRQLLRVKGRLCARWDTPSGLAQAFAKACVRAEVDATSFHSLRHGCAVRMLREGAHVRAVQTRLRHGNLQTTAKYLEQAAFDLPDCEP